MQSNIRIYYLAIICTTVLYVSCSKNNSDIELKPEAKYLIGNWIGPVYSNDTIIYKNSAALIENKLGMSIQENGRLIERQNSGWCGTPPIVYSDYQGRWNLDENIINVNGTYWGGKTTKQWKIIKITSQQLTIKILTQKFSQ